jgi:RND family efflux transporter MFP subunit
VVRLTSLVKNRNVSQSQLDQTIADRAVARGDLAIAQARVDQAAERLARSEIKAPFAGVVTERLLQAGEWADSSDTVVRLVDASSLEVRTWVTAEVLPFLQKGVLLTLSAGERQRQGTIATIVGVSGTQSRMYELRLTVADNPWPVGISLKVAVPTAAQRQAIVVPRDALVLRRSGSAVFRINEDNSADRVSVSTGIAEGALIEVHGGIQPGDKVVTNGGERLRPGQTVQIINAGGN